MNLVKLDPGTSRETSINLDDLRVVDVEDREDPEDMKTNRGIFVLKNNSDPNFFFEFSKAKAKSYMQGPNCLLPFSNYVKEAMKF